MSKRGTHGLIGSIIDNVEKLNPLALITDTKNQMDSNKCTEVSLPVVTQLSNGSSKLKYEKQFIGTQEKNNLKNTICLTEFKDEINRRNKNLCNIETFSNMNNYLDPNNLMDYRLMLNQSNICLDNKIYHSFISILIIYCIYKLIK